MDSQHARLIKKIRRIFPERSSETIFTALRSYGVEPHEREPYRVYLAILKLSEEDHLSDVSFYLKVAKQDHRDVLAWAEYPNQTKLGPNADSEERAESVRKDKAQYRAWLEKT